MTQLDNVPDADTHTTHLRTTRWKTGLSMKKAKARLRLTMALLDILVRIYIKLKGLSPWRVPGWRGIVFVLIAAVVFGFCMYCHWVHASDTIVGCVQKAYGTITNLFTISVP
jgi:hypothetical protein